jgi:hypothetical protein
MTQNNKLEQILKVVEEVYKKNPGAIEKALPEIKTAMDKQVIASQLHYILCTKQHDLEAGESGCRFEIEEQMVSKWDADDHKYWLDRTEEYFALLKEVDVVKDYGDLKDLVLEAAPIMGEIEQKLIVGANEVIILVSILIKDKLNLSI